MSKGMWDNLSIKEKADVIKVAIRNGVVGLPEIRERYNSFAGGGYTEWLEKLSHKKSKEWGIPQKELYNQMLNDETYSYETFYNSNREDAEKMLTADPNAHFNDSGKTYLHPTYSNESKVPNQPFKGGHWSEGPWGKNSNTYTLSKEQIDNRWDIGRTMDYLSEAEDNGVVMRMPNGELVRDERGNVFGGVLPAVEVGRGNLFWEGGDKNSASQRAMEYLMSKGISKTGASAIVGTLQTESGLDPTIHAKMPGDTGVGLAQWTGSRRNTFWKVLEGLEPGAKKKYGSIDRVPFEKQLDVVLAERPDVMQAISNAKDVNTATDIMLRGYENGGGTVKTMASRGQMDRIYGKWNNGYNNQMKKRAGNAGKLLGINIDLSQYSLPQEFFDGIDEQIANMQPAFETPMLIENDPTVYKAPVIDETLFAQPSMVEEESVYDPQRDRVDSMQRMSNVFTMMRMESPFSGMEGSPLMMLGNV